MHLLETFALIIATVFAIPTLASRMNDIAYGGLDDQFPIAVNDDPITKIRLLTKTHYEINVVSTVYRTRTRTDDSHATETVGYDKPVQTLAFAVEGTVCDMKACTICRLLNDCSEDETNW